MAPAAARPGWPRSQTRWLLAGGSASLAFGLFLALARLHGYSLSAWNTACENGTGTLGRELASGSLRSDCWMRAGYHVEGLLMLAGALLLIISGGAYLGRIQPQRLPLRLLASALVPQLIILAGLHLAGVWIRLPAMAGDVASAMAGLTFLAWLFCARLLAERTHCRQRLPRGWVIAGFGFPIVMLWYPFKAVADIWRASLPHGHRSRRATLARWWWGSWLAAEFISIPASNGRSFGPFTLGIIPAASLLAGALSAALTATMVSQISAGLARPPIANKEPSPHDFR